MAKKDTIIEEELTEETVVNEEYDDNDDVDEYDEYDDDDDDYEYDGDNYDDEYDEYDDDHGVCSNYIGDGVWCDDDGDNWFFK